MSLVDVDLIMTWLWCAIGWCWPDYDLASWHCHVIGWCWPDSDLALMCHWLMLTWLWLGFDMPLVDVDLIMAWQTMFI